MAFSEVPTLGMAWLRDTFLSPRQTLLEYLVGDSSVFVFLIQPTRLVVREIKKDSLETWVENMTRNGIYGNRSNPPRLTAGAANQNYEQAAQQLYQQLLAPIDSLLTPELIIIPDGVLGYMPFEALLTAAPKFPARWSGYPYLLKKHQISYCYSATLLREMSEKKNRPASPGRLLAMAPMMKKMESADPPGVGFSLRDTLLPLSGSGPEVAAISKIWGGQAFSGAKASIARFHALAPQHRILHLATHGKADDRQGDYAWLAFAGENGHFEKLYARDLYAMELNADMVVLSACETGIGRLRRGEGIISLARAFAYAGAQSIVTTLWPVNDDQTKALMTGFYQNLHGGNMAKDAALRKAQLELIEKNTHPFFWAGFIAVGDMRAIR